jgi:hypothetical protein
MHLNYVAASFIGIGLRCRTGSAHRGDERIHVVRRESGLGGTAMGSWAVCSLPFLKLTWCFFGHDD